MVSLSPASEPPDPSSMKTNSLGQTTLLSLYIHRAVCFVSFLSHCKHTDLLKVELPPLPCSVKLLSRKPERP